MDDNVRRFVKGITTMDDPTPSNGGYEDPTYLGFSLSFDFDPMHRDMSTGQTEDALFADNGELESATRYLINIGFPEKANMLKQFKEELRYINTKAPYYFQTVTGLADIWKIEKGKNFNNFRGKDKVLTFELLESIDMKMTALADLYRKATFDVEYMREILPDNLRWFTLTLRIAEMRKFHTLKKKALEISQGRQIQNANNTSTFNQSTTNDVDDSNLKEVEGLISVVEFQLSHCEFDFEDSFEDEYNMNGTQEMAKQKMKIRVGHISEKNTYQLLNLLLADGYNVTQGAIKEKAEVAGGVFAKDKTTSPDSIGISKIQKMDKAVNPSSKFTGVGNAIKGSLDNLNQQLKNLGPNAINSQVNKLESLATGLALGNVNDFKNQSLSQILNGFTSQKDQIQEKLGDVFPNVPGKDSVTNIATDLGKAYINPTKREEPDTLGNAFGGIPPKSNGPDTLGNVNK